MRTCIRLPFAINSSLLYLNESWFVCQVYFQVNENHYRRWCRMSIANKTLKKKPKNQRILNVLRQSHLKVEKCLRHAIFLGYFHWGQKWSLQSFSYSRTHNRQNRNASHYGVWVMSKSIRMNFGQQVYHSEFYSIQKLISISFLLQKYRLS